MNSNEQPNKDTPVAYFTTELSKLSKCGSFPLYVAQFHESISLSVDVLCGNLSIDNCYPYLAASGAVQLSCIGFAPGSNELSRSNGEAATPNTAGVIWAPQNPHFSVWSHKLPYKNISAQSPHKIDEKVTDSL